jgi:hypothetical protein
VLSIPQAEEEATTEASRTALATQRPEHAGYLAGHFGWHSGVIAPAAVAVWGRLRTRGDPEWQLQALPQRRRHQPTSL